MFGSPVLNPRTGGQQFFPAIAGATSWPTWQVPHNASVVYLLVVGGAASGGGGGGSMSTLGRIVVGLLGVAMFGAASFLAYTIISRARST